MRFFGGVLVFLFSLQAFAEFDFLAQQTLPIKHSNPESVLNKTAANVKAIFQRYKVAVDSSSTIISPLQVGGTQDRPVLKVSVRKCVAFVCQNVDLDAEVSLREGRGNCHRNFLMQADLSRSGNALRDVYDRLDVAICFKNVKQGEAALEITAHAHRAPSYSAGIVQREILSFSKLQIKPIAQALAETLRSHGAN